MGNKKEALKNLKAYEEDVREINLICVREDLVQADVIRKLLQHYLKTKK